MLDLIFLCFLAAAARGQLAVEFAGGARGGGEAVPVHVDVVVESASLYRFR